MQRITTFENGKRVDAYQVLIDGQLVVVPIEKKARKRKGVIEWLTQITR